MPYLNASRTGWILAGWIGVLPALASASPPGGSAPLDQSQLPSTPPTPAQVEAAKPVQNASQQQTKSKLEQEKELRKIRAKFLGSMRNKEIRQIGIDKVRQFTDPVIFPSLLEIFEREEADVRNAILDHLAEFKTNEADATIAWAGIHDRDADYRAAATQRLAHRAAESGDVCNMVKVIIANALKSPKDSVAGAAAELAAGIKLYEAIPAIINAQVTGNVSATDIGGPPPPALADIIIATQQAFIADLEPVVGDNAVAFDPTLGVVTDGTVLRVLGASVITYRTIVHNALVRLADSGWDGRSTASMGWDNDAWRTWYANEFKPYRAKVEPSRAPAPVPPPK